MRTDEIKQILAGEPAYRIKQAVEAVYGRLISDWSEASSLPAAARSVLSAKVPLSSLSVVRTARSGKGDAIKCAFTLADGQTIEAVLMRHGDGRNTVCVSSQAGCPMACAFCATGAGGFKRNLEPDEIADQVLHFARLLKKEKEAVTNLVVMGMGEPMNNYDNVLAALKLLNDPAGFGLGARRMSVSTCGIAPGILRLAEEPLQVNLAVSLHAPTDELRSKLMPVNRAFPLGKLFEALKAYLAKTGRKIMFEYLLIDGVNDRPEDAEALAALLNANRPEGRGASGLYHVNLIKYHLTKVPEAVALTFGLPIPPVDRASFKPSPPAARKRFMSILEEKGIAATFRVSFGEDIEAACGQLAGRAG